VAGRTSSVVNGGYDEAGVTGDPSELDRHGGYASGGLTCPKQNPQVWQDFSCCCEDLALFWAPVCLSSQTSLMSRESWHLRLVDAMAFCLLQPVPTY